MGVTTTKIENLATEMYNVFNTFYSNDNEKKKAICNMVEKIYNNGWSEGYHEAERDEQGF